jgi:diguanylate cyclase (GGDEF)-like protein
VKAVWKILPLVLVIFSPVVVLLRNSENNLYLIIWSVIVLLLFFPNLFFYIKEKREFGFVISLVLITNTAIQLTDQPLKFIYFPVAVLGAFFFSSRTIIIATLIVIISESLNLYISDSIHRDITQHIIFSSALLLLSLTAGLLFGIERKRREDVSKTLKSLEAKAESINPFDGIEGKAALEAISDNEVFGHLIASAMELEKNLQQVVDLIKGSLSANTVCLFVPEKGGALTINAFSSETENIRKDKKIEIGKGYVGWIGKEKIPLIVSELKGGYEALGFYGRDAGVKSFLGIPLLYHGLLMGIITADSLNRDAFSKRDTEILEAFGVLVIQLLKKAKVDQQIEFSARGVKALHEISSVMSSTLNLKEMGQKLIDLSGMIAPYNHGGLLLYDESKDEMELLASKNWDGIEGGSRFSAERSLVGWIARNRQPVLFSDLKTRRERIPIAPEINIKARSFLGIPLDMKGERVVGVFALSSVEPGAFTGFQQYLLSILCNQAAVLITNAKLHFEMEKMAVTDGLTGLMNHKRFQERLAEEFRRIVRHSEPLTLILADIDHFKKVNDECGHPAGDEILKGVANILKEMVRDIDVVARYGGEEFAIILINTDSKGACMLAERIRKTVEKRNFSFGGINVPVTLSLGIASYPRNGRIKDELISMADSALYRAKKEGRNRTCLYQG